MPSPGPVPPAGAQPTPPAGELLKWYDRHRRTMPWRAKPGESPDPYRVWLSEVMLQQTTVAAVTPFFNRFLARFPTVEALAAAPEAAVMEAWAGLGYYARARNLHACAKAVAAAGAFPRDLPGLRALPGIGPYTAAAVASIAFAVPIVPVDGNVERVAARVFAIPDPLPSSRPAAAAAAARLGNDGAARARPADFTQALFDLGATVCTPRNPACALCPWRTPCAARARGLQDRLPAKSPKPLRPLRHGALFWLDDGEHVLLRRRPPSGLLGGMLGFPGTPWRPAPWPAAEALSHAPRPAPWNLVGQAPHGFTHFELRLDVYAARVPRLDAPSLPQPPDLLQPLSGLAAAALPTAMRRAAAVAQAAGFGPAPFTSP